MKKFRLTDTFIEKYKTVQPPFGFNGLGELAYLRTYSRLKEDNSNEVWYETCRRVVEGTYNMQKRHILENGLGWNETKAQYSAQEMYDRMFHMKFLPPGRGLWAMGSPLTEERGLWAALNNCGFVSTKNIATDLEEPFTWMMDASMLGIGVGFDTLGAESMKVKGFASFEEPCVVPDTREGWVASVGQLILNGLTGGPRVKFDYSQVRPAGVPIKGFGGVSSGPDPLRLLHEQIAAVLSVPHDLTSRTITDLMNLIGACVVAGNVRRTAQIAFGQPDDQDYLQLKNYRWDNASMSYQGPSAERAAYGWTSNNSVFCEAGMDYGQVATMTAVNGEPGYAWLENMRAYGRMRDGEKDWRDRKVAGGNPCLEQSLESYELCCLVETFPNNHEDFDDYQRTLKFAYLYAKTVTLGKTPWEKTNRVMLRNRRIGCSQSGIQQFIAARGIDEYVNWCDEGYSTIQEYDAIYSDWFCIPRSIKTTSVKPSGTVSLLAGATPGMHWPESLYYIRRMRLAKDSELVAPLLAAGYKVEPAVGQESSTVVVEIPVSLVDGSESLSNLRTVREVSMWEQLAMAALIQKHWADNQVSSTVTFNLETEGRQIEHALNYYQYQLKGVSFLPLLEAGAYAQMPYEAIGKSKYEEMAAKLSPIRLGHVNNERVELEPGCESGSCEIGARK